MSFERYDSEGRAVYWYMKDGTRVFLFDCLSCLGAEMAVWHLTQKLQGAL